VTIIATHESRELLDAIAELSLYRSESPVATAFNVGNSFFTVNEAWRKAAPRTHAQILEHYRTCEAQVEQQVFATYGIPHELVYRKMVVGQIEPFQTVLDMGAGIGTMVLALPDAFVTHADVAGPMMRYANWRYERGRQRNGLDWSFPFVVELEDDYLDHEDDCLAGVKYDVVICTEVIEHTVDPMKLAHYLVEHCKPGGKLFLTTSFHDDDGVIPMHLNLDKWTDEKFEREVLLGELRLCKKHLDDNFYFYRKQNA